MNRAELCIVIRVGPNGAPLIVAKTRDPRLLRQAVANALEDAESKIADPASGDRAHQQVRLLATLLGRLEPTVGTLEDRIM